MARLHIGKHVTQTAFDCLSHIGLVVEKGDKTSFNASINIVCRGTVEASIEIEQLL
jgi:hypothetical protein